MKWFLVGVAVGLSSAIAYAVRLVASHDEAMLHDKGDPSRRVQWFLQTLSVVVPLFAI
jgi:hypothetical protein